MNNTYNHAFVSVNPLTLL